MGHEALAFKVTSTTSSAHWQRIERLTTLAPCFASERAGRRARQPRSSVIAGFGTDQPTSEHVLLHFGPGWESRAGVPVLLVHGATSDAGCWLDPYHRRGEGLALTLMQEGFRVFAVSFAHRHGDNLIQAAHLAHAIARIRALTGAPHVDVIAHSKGTVAVRALASGLPLPGGVTYQGDIRRMLLIGGPHKGIDYAFRHAALNYAILMDTLPKGYSAPMVWSRAIYMGRWIETTGKTLLKDARDSYPGQRQMLARLDYTYRLPRIQADWFTTYYGGHGLVSESVGIDTAIAQGGHLIERLCENPLDSAIQLAVLAGSRANRVGMLNEYTGPSDGTVFIESAIATDAMLSGGATLLARDVIDLNHGELIYHPRAKAWVVQTLRAAVPGSWAARSVC
jgi:triacylglycerol esterase/lipase EstA (alpha/beta hydrolase family)